MIPVDRKDVYEAGLEGLRRFGETTKARGRFILLYLGLRRMRPSLGSLAPGQIGTSATEIQELLDQVFLKTFRPEPFVVLTAPFGQSNSPTAPYSTRTGEYAPKHKSPTNTWRNNLNIQKGICCPAEPDVIQALLDDPRLRDACPHMDKHPDGTRVCLLRGTKYRGEAHSIWLRMVTDGYQVVDLNHLAVYRDYLSPAGKRIPVFPLIAVLYPFAPPGIYPDRKVVGIPEFASDFGFDVSTVVGFFECDPESPANAAVLAAKDQVTWTAVVAPATPQVTPSATGQQPVPSALPVVAPEGQLNTGVGAEIAVGTELQQYGWTVEYFGNQKKIGYDLRATGGGDTKYVEVKSSVGLCTPELTEDEWKAAEEQGAAYVVAFVDFFGSESQSINYVPNPVATANAIQLQKISYRLPRDGLAAVAVGASSL